jgi:arylsulfatase A-like enzyme
LTDRPNVLLIVLDTVRGDVVTPHTGERVTPFLARFAEGALVFRHAYSTSDWTLPAHASMLTGQLPSGHGVNYNVGYEALEGGPGLAHRLREAGWATWGLSNNPWFGDMTNLDQGFQEFRLYHPRERFWLTPVNYLKDRVYDDFARAPVDWKKRMALAYEWTVKGWIDDGCGRTFRDLLALVSGGDGRPWFAMVNVIEAHGHFIPPQPFRSRFAGEHHLGRLLAINQDAYNHHFGVTEMTGADFAALRQLYEAEVAGLSRRGVLDDTLVIVTSDHGENIGDHGLMEHRWCVYDSLIHVPLLMRLPRGHEDLGGRVAPDDLVSLCDLYPTIAGMLGLDIHGGDALHGIDVLDGGREHVVAEMVPRQLPRGSLPEEAWARFAPLKVALRTREEKVIWSSDGAHEAYRCLDDPSEDVNVYDPGDAGTARLLERVGTLSDTEALARQLQTAEGRKEGRMGDRAMRDRLRALGYMS